MDTLLILFFASIIGISFMVGRKLSLIRRGQLQVNHSGDEFLYDMPGFHEIKKTASKSSRKLGYIALFLIIKSYLLSTSFLKRKYGTLKKHATKIKSKYVKTSSTETTTKEASKFLKMISEYKKKINRIKHKIKKEEGIE